MFCVCDGFFDFVDEVIVSFDVNISLSVGYCGFFDRVESMVSNVFVVEYVFEVDDFV